MEVRFTPDLEAKLARIAADQGRDTADLVIESVDLHLEELEDATIAMRRLEQPAKRWTLKELEHGVDLAS
jgi:predicted DNA-binding protein